MIWLLSLGRLLFELVPTCCAQSGFPGSNWPFGRKTKNFIIKSVLFGIAIMTLVENDKDKIGSIFSEDNKDKIFYKDPSKLTTNDAKTSIERWICTGLDAVGKAVIEDGCDEVVEDFSLWLGDQMGVEQESLRSVLHTVTTIAVLEAANHVLNLGSGFSKLDATGFTLHQIKKTVERIEKKVDLLVDNPMKMCLSYLNDLKSQILYGNNVLAFRTAEKLHDKAIEAVHNAKVGSLKGFNQKVEAIRFVIFAKILLYSYCSDQETFIPYNSLPIRKVNGLVDEIETWIEDCFCQKSKVNTKKLIFMNCKFKSAKLQALLDSILMTTYPIMSEAKGWTSTKTWIKDSDKELVIRIGLVYVPSGYENHAEMIVGVKVLDSENGTREVVKIKLWKTETHVYASCEGAARSEMEIESKDNGVVTMLVNMEQTVVTELVIAGNNSWGLGQYGYDPEYDCHKQVSTEGGDPRYLYNVDGCWYVGVKPGDKQNVFLKNEEKSKMIPGHGWMCKVEGKWTLDCGVHVTPGKMKVCRSVTIISAEEISTEYQECLGEFRRTKRWRYGRPIFVNDHGQILYNNGGWRIGRKIGKWDLYSSSSPLCPAKTQDQWYAEGGMFGHVKLTIKCNIH